MSRSPYAFHQPLRATLAVSDQAWASFVVWILMPRRMREIVKASCSLYCEGDVMSVLLNCASTNVVATCIRMLIN